MDALLDDVLDIMDIAGLPHAAQLLKWEVWGDGVGELVAVAGLLSITKVAKEGVHLGSPELMFVRQWTWYGLRQRDIEVEPRRRNSCTSSRDFRQLIV